ncbi:MAG: GNAT family N-acetyltransferase [Dehalococcoidales bacterium]
MPNFEIRPLDESEYSLWDNFVEESPNGTIFHKTFWIRDSGRKFIIYGYFKGGELYAGIPLTYINKLGIKIASQPILIPYLGVIFKKQDTKYVNRLTQEKEMSREIARRLKMDFYIVSFSSCPGLADFQPFLWEGFSAEVNYTYIINLENSLDDIWKAMDDRARNIIRKAEKDGICVVMSDDFNQTLNLVEKTLARQDMSTIFKLTAMNYNDLLRARGQCKSFFAKDKKGDYIAVVYIVWDSKRSYYLLGGYDAERSHIGASSIAVWEAIKYTKENLGLREFDFEGSLISQVELFFRKFGGMLTPYYNIKWVKPYLNPTGLLWKLGRFILSRL